MTGRVKLHDSFAKSFALIARTNTSGLRNFPVAKTVVVELAIVDRRLAKEEAGKWPRLIKPSNNITIVNTTR